MRHCTSSFPSVTELTLSVGFHGPVGGTVTDFTRILPLTTLTQLHISDRSFSFEKVIYLLQHAPKIRNLKVFDTSFYTMDSLLREKSEVIQLVSTQNIVQTLTIESQCNAEQMELILHLFPRLQHITMSIFCMDFSAIFELLFSKMKDKTEHLFSICLEDESGGAMRKVAKLRQKKNWMEYDFSMKFIDDRLYIWW